MTCTNSHVLSHTKGFSQFVFLSVSVCAKMSQRSAACEGLKALALSCSLLLKSSQGDFPRLSLPCSACDPQTHWLIFFWVSLPPGCHVLFIFLPSSFTGFVFSFYVWMFVWSVGSSCLDFIISLSQAPLGSVVCSHQSSLGQISLDNLSSDALFSHAGRIHPLSLHIHMNVQKTQTLSWPPAPTPSLLLFLV